MPQWVLDSQMQSYDRGMAFKPAPGTPPTTPESAVQVAIRTLGGVGNISGNVRMGYVLATTRWPELKDRPMWVVQVDQTMVHYPFHGSALQPSRSQVLIDADTGEEYGHFDEEELPPSSTGSHTPVPG